MSKRGQNTQSPASKKKKKKQTASAAVAEAPDFVALSQKAPGSPKDAMEAAEDPVEAPEMGLVNQMLATFMNDLQTFLPRDVQDNVAGHVQLLSFLDDVKKAESDLRDQVEYALLVSFKAPSSGVVCKHEEEIDGKVSRFGIKTEISLWSNVTASDSVTIKKRKIKIEHDCK